ncbi:indole-3-glycerol phosphate synthase [Methanocella sp. CWC-04]|uniref:indole-3-glycerol-phosphate synthase n=1 Tax=Methanooceanicella nereidis TaxID=2052831 RepID=A0AAP2RGR3_9EURY|nr:indole-3-glycerol phosphate synthase [Methanocella sp. CWC-04]
MDFNSILRSRMKDFRPFDQEVKVIRKPMSLIDSICRAKAEGKNPVIAEIKPASPLAGQLRKIDDPRQISKAFVNSGACGISVLTEPKFFRGSLNTLKEVSRDRKVPVLRKDFLFDISQVKESYHYGADSLLLISSFFDSEGLGEMISESRRYGMEPLVEIHSEEDAGRAVSAGAKLFAINNRDKDTLKIDIKRTERLAGFVEGVRVSASGIEDPGQLRYVLQFCDAALIGSALMMSAYPSALLKAFVEGGEL